MPRRPEFLIDQGSLSVYDLLKDQAEENPEANAIAAPRREPLTYRRLLSQVESIVTRLNAMGLGRQDRIAIVLPNGPEMAVAFLAIAAGAVSAPLDPALRPKEFEILFSDLGVRALLVQSGIDSPAIAVAKSRGIPVITLTPQPKAEAGVFSLTGDVCTPSPKEGFAGTQDLSLVLSTSGTTARPKIVPLTHANICSSAYNIQESLGLLRSDRCLNVMPLFHIHGLIGALLSSLAAGSCTFCAQGFQAPRFFEWVDEYGPTWYTAVPSIHQAILTRVAMHRQTIRHCQLRFVRSCSAPLPPQVMAELEQVFDAPTIEAYGMTEAAHQIACNPLPPGRRKPGSVGLATGVQVAIMAPGGHLLPLEHAGEIVIRGVSVTRGYENDASANEAAWCGGWFRTGDQGYQDSEGYIFLTGRLKEMILRAGENIAPREIEEVLLEHPAVAQAVAFAVPHARLGQDVAAAVSLREDVFILGTDLREYAAQRLTHSKVPSRILLVKEIPKGPTGKVQRIGLDEKLGLVKSGDKPGREKGQFVAPGTPLEKDLAKMWTEVLGIQTIGIHENFFQAGGDSIMAIELYTRICQAMQAQVSLVRFFELPTIAGQAWAISNSQPGTPSPSLVPIQPAGSKLPFFCVPSGADVMELLDLGRLLGPGQPFYALHPGELQKRGIPYTAENAADLYLNEIRSMHPGGPYLLGGRCVGSGVALRLAHQLIAHGQQVALLALLDPVLHGLTGRSPRQYWQSLSQLSLVEKLSRVRGTLRVLMKIFRQQTHNRILRSISQNHSSSVGNPRHALQEVHQANIRALRKYARQNYPGRLTVFLASEHLSELRPSSDLRPSLDPRVVWRRIATDELDLHVIPGDHNVIIRYPYVTILAESLRACLDNAISTASENKHSSTASP